MRFFFGGGGDVGREGKLGWAQRGEGRGDWVGYSDNYKCSHKSAPAFWRIQTRDGLNPKHP